MIRYTLFLAIVAGTAATAIANVNPAKPVDVQASGSSLVYKTSLSQVAMADSDYHVVLEKCAVEDCSDTPQ
ncbi:hypothetical protein [Aestuariivirga litoralis]|uniref:hypothetical protein n=1 Tax=Aestuariivirga litoralis TaxID=2650924 RepID=UPI0018C4780C|nr:hypothetical protein [Aestuariivirga litoralis]MBG1231047.1 hypothetical protein [Aestuariivirga litoralis]